MGNHLADVLTGAGARADQAFLIDPDGATLTYGDMLAGSARIAHALVGLGVRPGDRVAAQVAKSPQAILLYLGAVRAGAVF